MAQNELKFYINGKFYPASEAKISVMDRSFLYGDAVTEGILVWKGAPYKLDEHMKRMFQGMSILMIQSPVTYEEARNAIIETIRVNSFEQGWLRPQITRGEGQFSDKWNELSAKANFLIIVGLYPPDWLKVKGQRAMVATTRRVPPSCIPAATKNCNYLNNIMASIERVQSGADVAIMLDTGGSIAEGTTFNVFLSRGNHIYTPTTRNCFPGITRAIVIDLARKAGYQVTELDHVEVSDLYLADEVFGTSTSKLCLSMVEVNGRKIGDGKPGPIMTKLRQALIEDMDKYAQNYKA